MGIVERVFPCWKIYDIKFWHHAPTSLGTLRILFRISHYRKIVILVKNLQCSRIEELWNHKETSSYFIWNINILQMLVISTSLDTEAAGIQVGGCGPDNSSRFQSRSATGPHMPCFILSGTSFQQSRWFPLHLQDDFVKLPSHTFRFCTVPFWSFPFSKHTSMSLSRLCICHDNT